MALFFYQCDEKNLKGKKPFNYFFILFFILQYKDFNYQVDRQFPLRSFVSDFSSGYFPPCRGFPIDYRTVKIPSGCQSALFERQDVRLPVNKIKPIVNFPRLLRGIFRLVFQRSVVSTYLPSILRHLLIAHSLTYLQQLHCIDLPIETTEKFRLCYIFLNF